MATEDQDPSTSNLLDRVMQSQQSETLEHFDAIDTVNNLLKLLSNKEADVLRRRYGLGPADPETLEVIGQSYKVTRERVRQIQHWSIQRLKKSPQTAQLLHGLVVVLQQLLETHGNLMLEEELLARLQGASGESRTKKAAVNFLLEQLLDDKVVRVDSADYKTFWKLKFASLNLLEPVIKAAADILTKVGKPVPMNELINQLASNDFIRQQADNLNEQILTSYLQVAKTVDRNPFGEVGMRSWGTIVPKRMHDKILLVMRKHGKPMHFQEIAQRINEIGFDHRQAYPPTVHNELILNQEYVLVGRGIYALKEWGYKPGVVAEVIVDTLKSAGQPLSREEIVERVLQQRQVKKNTIYLALTNKQRFVRQADGRYALANV